MPVKDRLNEFHQQMELVEKKTTEPRNGFSDKNHHKIMDEVTNDNYKDNLIQMFLTDASKINVELAKMKADVAEIVKLQQNMMSTPFVDNKDVTKYEALGEQVRCNATKIGDSLKQLEKKFDSGGLPDENAFKRVRMQQLTSLTTELNILTNEFFKIQAEYMDKMKTNLRRQLMARGDSADDSKISTILDHDSYSVFTDNYIINVNDAEQTLRDLEDRKKDILALEKSVMDVNLLFKDLNLLVSTQGETIKRIENTIDSVVVQVESATTELKKAKEYQSKARRKKCCIIIVILIILAVIALILGIVLGTQN